MDKFKSRECAQYPQTQTVLRDHEWVWDNAFAPFVDANDVQKKTFPEIAQMVRALPKLSAG